LQAVIATKKQDNTGKDWDELLPAATYAYNVTPQTTTQVAPYSLFFGREARLPIMEENSQVPYQRHNAKFLKIRRIFESVSVREQKLQRHQSFAPGDAVLLWRPNALPGQVKKFHTPWIGPFTVVRRIGWMNYEIIRNPGQRNVVHATQLKPWYGRPTKEKPTEEKPTEEKPTEEKPTEGKTTEEKPTEQDKEHRGSGRYQFRPFILKPTRFI